MQLRRYTTEDLDLVIEIFRSNIPKYFDPAEEPGLRRFLFDLSSEDSPAHGGREIDYFVAESDGEVVGSGGIGSNKDHTVSLCWGMIRADYLGTGLGRKLTEFRIQKAREQFGDLPLVISTSQHTQGFYEKLGFQIVSIERDGFGSGIDNCKMQLDRGSSATPPDERKGSAFP